MPCTYQKPACFWSSFFSQERWLQVNVTDRKFSKLCTACLPARGEMRRKGGGGFAGGLRDDRAGGVCAWSTPAPPGLMQYAWWRPLLCAPTWLLSAFLHPASPSALFGCGQCSPNIISEGVFSLSLSSVRYIWYEGLFNFQQWKLNTLMFFEGCPEELLWRVGFFFSICRESKLHDSEWKWFSGL